MNSNRQQYMVGNNSKSCSVGLILVYALLLTSLIGKSYLFAMYRSVWTVQMILTVVIVTVLCFYFLFVLLNRRLSLSNYSLKMRLKICLFLMLLFGIFSCCAQENLWMNLAFFAVHASSIMILFIFGPRLIANVNRKRFLDIVLVPLVVITLLSISVFAGNNDNGRLFGLYGNAIIAGQMLGITSILLFWKIVYHQKQKTKFLWFLFIVSMLGLILTRTRTDIAGAFLGITMCLLMTLWHSDMVIAQKRAKILVFLFIPLSILTLFWFVAAEFELTSVREYLRLGENVEETIQNRQIYWEKGFERINAKNVLGNGPLDKFGDDVSLSGSGYDRDSNAHNTLFSVIQYYGWSGGFLFVLFLILLLSVFLSKQDCYSVLGISILTFGIIQCISENWLLSFGTPLDLYSWFILGWCLSGESYRGNFSQSAFSSMVSPEYFLLKKESSSYFNHNKKRTTEINAY